MRVGVPDYTALPEPTYGSEFNAARTATEQIIDLHYTLHMLGVPVVHSYMFGDNKSVVLNWTVPHSQLNKRHNALAYHRYCSWYFTILSY